MVRISENSSGRLIFGFPCEFWHVGPHIYIYEDLNEISSAILGGCEQLEIPPSINSKQAASFSSPAGFSPGTGILTPARILLSACFSVKRQDFVNPPDFLKSARIL